MLADKIEKIYESNRELDYTQINKEYIYSVSKIVEQFKEPFDVVGQAERCSRKYKNDPNSKYYVIFYPYHSIFDNKINEYE